jgi:plasmid stability protein
MDDNLIAFRDTELKARIAEKAARDNKSFPDTCRDLLRFALDTTDNRPAADVIPFHPKNRTGTRVYDNPNGKGKSINTVALRDDPLGAMYEDGQLTKPQYDVAMHVARYFEIARGNQVKSNAIGKERIDSNTLEVTRQRYALITAEHITEAKTFLRDVYKTIGVRRYQILHRVLDDGQPTMQVAEFAAALDKLASLCGYATERKAA